MKEYIVTKDILNIRSKPSDESDDTFVGQLLKGDRVWLEDEEVTGVVPKGGESNIWKVRTGSENVVAGDGVVAASEFWIKEFGIDELWKTTKGEGVTIILVDSGVKHCADLEQANITRATILTEKDMTDNVGHGTLMASIICGSGKNISGVSPNAEIISLKFTNAVSNLNTNDFVAACELIPKMIQEGKYYIVNFSLDLSEDMSEDNKTSIQKVINSFSKNVIFSAAVGNTPIDNKTIPAGLENVISCSGMRKENESYVRFRFSNYWDEILINAPCEFPAAHLTPLFNENIPSQGTSHACAFISGLIALLLSCAKSKNKKVDFEMMKRFLLNSCNTITDENKSFRILNKEKFLHSFNNFNS
jgi:hypothetical protein